MITKEKEGVVKRRLILDCKRGPDGDVETGVIRHAVRAQRIILPTGRDVVFDALGIQTTSPEQDFERLVLDISDAFFQVPLRHPERRFFVAQYKHRYLVFLTIARGSTNAPLIWGRMAALIGRLTQAMFSVSQVRIQTYVDDPCATVAGTPNQRDRRMAILLLTWRALGQRLAFKKGSRGADVIWIGHHLRKEPEGVRIGVKPELRADVVKATGMSLSVNLIGLKDSQRYIGKCNRIAGVVPSWRPFLRAMWGAMAEAQRTSPQRGHAKGCVWTKQVKHTLLWVRAFLSQAQRALSVFFRFDSYSAALRVRISTDACPTGIGGYLTIDNEIREFFRDPLTDTDAQTFNVPLRDAAGQQTWKALAVLCALRLWEYHSAHGKVILTVLSDSIAALHMVFKTHSAGFGPRLVARELALVLARWPHIPTVAEHLPGIANKLADWLSREGITVGSSIPATLRGAQERHLPSLDASSYAAMRRRSTNAIFGSAHAAFLCPPPYS